jgi:hypothetical protein
MESAAILSAGARQKPITAVTAIVAEVGAAQEQTVPLRHFVR